MAITLQGGTPMEATVYGYIRVSTREQNEARQINAMREFGVPWENMVIEKQSGKDFQRPYYQNLIERLCPGDTRQERDLTGRLITDIVLQLLSYVAETERQNIRQRQAEGIRAARKRGDQLGRKKITMPPDFAGLARAWQQGEISSRAAAKQLGVSYQTFLRRAKEV